MRTSSRLLPGLFLAVLVASAQQQRMARPGALNYVEGQVTLDGQPVQTKQIGSLEVAPGHVLQTADGKAEMLLTPGVVLRLDSASAVKMIAPSLTNTKVELLKGKAMVEADQVEKENHLDIVDHGVNTVLEKKGIYEFDANNPMVAVYDGKAQVQEDDRTAEPGKGREVALTNNPKLKVEKFDRKKEDDLYAWSKLRSEYLAQANMASAQTIVVDNPGWWYGTGWYWSPWFDSWAFVPGSGYLYSPFGFGFYSPAFWYNYAPAYYWPGYGWRGRPVAGPVRHGFAGRGFAARGFARPAPAMRAPMGAGHFGGFGGAHIGGFSGGHFGGRR